MRISGTYFSDFLHVFLCAKGQQVFQVFDGDAELLVELADVIGNGLLIGADLHVFLKRHPQDLHDLDRVDAGNDKGGK